MYNQDFQNHLTQLDNITAISMSKNTNPFEAMSNVTDCNELHLMAHGSPGNLDLGSGIDTQALYDNAEYLSMLNVQKIILWGCNVGKDTEFIKTFSNLTNSAVYASKDYLGKNKGMSDEFPEMNDFIKSLPFYLINWTNTFGPSDANAPPPPGEAAVPPPPQIEALFFDPQGRIWAIAAGVGLAVSTDGGYNWDTKTIPTNPQGGTNRDVETVFVDGATIFLGSLFALDISYDSGDNWNSNVLPSMGRVSSVHKYGTTVVVGGDHGLIISGDGGTSWGALLDGNGAWVQSGRARVKVVFIDQNGIYAAPWAGRANQPGLYFSDDSGDSWTRIGQPGVTPGFSNSPTINSISSTANGVLNVGTGEGLSRSFDGGQTWTTITNSIHTGFGTIHPSQGIVAAAHVDLTRKQLTPAQRQAENNHVQAHYQYGTTVVVGTRGGVSISSDDGQNWTTYTNGQNGFADNPATVAEVLQSITRKQTHPFEWGQVRDSTRVHAVGGDETNIWCGHDHGLCISAPPAPSSTVSVVPDDAGDAGVNTGQFTVTQTLPSSTNTVISYTVTTPGATHDGEVVIAADALTAPIDVTAIVDEAGQPLLKVDAGETITVAITSVAAGTFLRGTSYARIMDPTSSSATVTIAGSVAADICFLAGTPVTTDQGAIAIEKLIPGTHTIKDQPILGISQTKSSDDHLLCFEKHALGHNIPDQQTIVSREHCILYKGKMKRACTFHALCSHPKNEIYRRHLIQCGYLKNMAAMVVNNMTVETLHPKHWVAKKLFCSTFSKS